MAGELTLEEGKTLVKLARKSISYRLASGNHYSEKAPSEKFLEKRGVFVTLSSHPKGDLRGCIGLPYPDKELWFAVIGAAVSAAVNDPRFPPLSSSELERATVEVSILTKPEEAGHAALPESVEIGKHGLIVERHSQSGLLLPQVATEYNWDAETFLDQACLKAGLYKGAWRLDDTTVKVFSAQIFKEEEPGGKIVEEKLPRQ